MRFALEGTLCPRPFATLRYALFPVILSGLTLWLPMGGPAWFAASGSWCRSVGLGGVDGWDDGWFGDWLTWALAWALAFAMAAAWVSMVWLASNGVGGDGDGAMVSCCACWR